MAEEPQPPNVTEGLDQPESLPANAEDRKAAQALNSLDAKADDEAPKKDVDLKALSDAMKNLGVGAEAKKPISKKEEAPKKPLIKVDPADVALVVSCSLRMTCKPLRCLTMERTRPSLLT